MKRITLLFLLFATPICFGQVVFINEIHYDNVGGDMNEAIEIAGPAGTDLSTYSLVLYNGATSGSTALLEYDTEVLSGTITDLQNGFGVINFPITGIQNGSADGIAFVNNGTDVIQFLSYEGTLTAADGPAMGMTSVDIGVVESNSTTAIGESLQLTGLGSDYSDFTWNAPATATAGSINSGQTFDPPLSIVENEKNTFALFPNPSINGSINIITEGNDSATVYIFNVLGNLIYTKKLDNALLKVNNLSTGIYLIRVEQNQNTATKKLIVK